MTSRTSFSKSLSTDDVKPHVAPEVDFSFNAETKPYQLTGGGYLRLFLSSLVKECARVNL